MPRIAQIYYGTEILLSDKAKPGDHGLIRTDFPGGWANDKVNAFTGEGLTKDQQSMQQFLKKMLNYRKSSDAIHTGKTVHFAPKDGVYVLFRIKNDEIVTIILNKNNAPFSLDLITFEEIGLQGKQVKNIISEKLINWNDSLELSNKGIFIFTTKI